MRLRIDRKRKRELAKFVALTRDKGEYRRGTAMLMLSGKKRRRVKDVAKELSVSVDAVIRWERSYKKQGLEGLRARAHTGRPPRATRRDKKKIEQILKQAGPAGIGLPEGEMGRP